MILLTLIILFFLMLSLTANGVLIWYCKKLIKNLNYGIKNVDELQNLLNQYADSMQSLYELEQFYGDETIKAAVDNTKMVVEACRIYKETIIEKQEKTIDNQE